MAPLADEAIKIIREDGGAVRVRQDWREPEKVVRPHLIEQPALRNGITRVEVAQALETGFEGRTVVLIGSRETLARAFTRRRPAATYYRPSAACRTQ